MWRKGCIRPSTNNTKKADHRFILILLWKEHRNIRKQKLWKLKWNDIFSTVNCFSHYPPPGRINIIYSNLIIYSTLITISSIISTSQLPLKYGCLLCFVFFSLSQYSQFITTILKWVLKWPFITTCTGNADLGWAGLRQTNLFSIFFHQQKSSCFILLELIWQPVCLGSSNWLELYCIGEFISKKWRAASYNF